MKVKDAMHKGVDWVGPDTPVNELAKLMRDHDVGAIPIGDNDHLVGMVTDRDIVCKGLAQDDFDPLSATARNVMTAEIVAVRTMISRRQYGTWKSLRFAGCRSSTRANAWSASSV
jgi:CBS domain-containing protein